MSDLVTYKAILECQLPPGIDIPTSQRGSKWYAVKCVNMQVTRVELGFDCAPTAAHTAAVLWNTYLDGVDAGMKG